MAQRYARSSYNDANMPIFSTQVIQLLQNGVTSGRNFWLRGISITNSHASQGVVVNLYDHNTEEASPTVTLQRGSVYVGPITTVVVDYGAPGIKFATGIVAGRATDVGTINMYDVSVWGYES